MTTKHCTITVFSRNGHSDHHFATYDEASEWLLTQDFKCVSVELGGSHTVADWCNEETDESAVAVLYNPKHCARLKTDPVAHLG